MAQVIARRSTPDPFIHEKQYINQTINRSNKPLQHVQHVDNQPFNRSPLSQLCFNPAQYQQYQQDPSHTLSMSQTPYDVVEQSMDQSTNQSKEELMNPAMDPPSNPSIDLPVPPVSKRLRVDTRKANHAINQSNYQASYQTYGMMHSKPNRLVNYGSFSVPSTPQPNYLSVYQWPGANQSIDQSMSPECSISPLTISVTPAQSPPRHNSPVNRLMSQTSIGRMSPIVEELPPQTSDLSSNQPIDQLDTSMDQLGEGTLLIPPHLDAIGSMLDDHGMISGSPASAPPNQSLEPRTPEPPCRRVREDGDQPIDQSVVQPMPLAESPTDDSQFSHSVQESINRSSSQSVETSSSQSINLLSNLSLQQGPDLDREYAQSADLPEMLATVSMVLHVQLVKAVNDPTTQSASQVGQLANFVEECPHYFSAGHPVFGVVKQPTNQQPINSQLLSVRELYSYLLYVFQKGKFEPDFALIMLIYFHRTLAYNRSITLSLQNWRPLLMTCLLLAQKMFDDSPLINTDFRYLYPYLIDRNQYRNQSSDPSISPSNTEKLVFARKFNRLEMELCQLIDWNLTVDESTYLLYRRELAAIWKEYDTRQKHTPVVAPQSAINQPISQPIPQQVTEVSTSTVPQQPTPQTTPAPQRKLQIPVNQPVNPIYNHGFGQPAEHSPYAWTSPSSASANQPTRKRKSSLSDFEPQYFLRSNNQQTINNHLYHPELVGSGPLHARPINQSINKSKETGHRRRHSVAR